MGGFSQFIAEQNAVGLGFEKKTARSVNRWLSEHGLGRRFAAERFKPGEGQRSEDFPDVYVNDSEGGGFFVECKEKARANMVNAAFRLDAGCNAVPDGESKGSETLRKLVNGSEGFKKFRAFMTGRQDLLAGTRPLDVYLGKGQFDADRLVSKYNKMVEDGLTEADCKPFDPRKLRASTRGPLAAALAWRLAGGRTWDICRIETNFAPILAEKYEAAGVKYVQLGESLFVVDAGDNPLGLDAPPFPEDAPGLFSLKFTPRFGVGGMYITPRSELKAGLESPADFNDRKRWPGLKGK